MGKPIIDVSAHNGTIDWAKVKDNVQAAIIRLGYTGYGNGAITYDAKYQANRAGCEANGIPFTLYYFPCSINDAEAKAEAQFIADACQGMSFPLPVFLDSEYAEPNGRGRADQLDKATRTRLLRIICEELQAKGIPAGVYASTSWLKSRLDVSQLPFYIWVASWTSSLGWTGSYALWQYSSSGSIPGISGRVDLSRPADNFEIPMQKGGNTTMSKCTAAAVIAVAAAEIGYKEKASNSSLDDKTANSGSGNWTKYARDFDQKWPNWYNGKKNGYAWCDMFVDWCFLTAFGYEAALRLLCQPEKSAGAGCTYSLGYYRAKGQFYTSPKPGDQIFFGTSISDSSHTGIVEKVEGSKVYTIEGNTSDQVARRSYALGASNIIGYGRPAYDEVSSSGSTPSPSKSVDEVAREVIAGAWGNGDDRKSRLTAAGYDYSAVQSRVNEILGSGNSTPSTSSKSVDELAQEVLAGKWGNGSERKSRLTAAGYDYSAVQSKVNALLGSSGGKSVDTLAQEVIAGKWGNGADRKARLTAAGYDYNAVQSRVNEILA